MSINNNNNNNCEPSEKKNPLDAKWKTDNGDADTKINLLPEPEDSGKITIENGKSRFYPQAAADISDDEYWTDEDEAENEDDKKSNLVATVVITLQQVAIHSYAWIKRHTSGYLIPCILLILYLIYFVMAMFYEFGSEASIRLLVCTVLGIVIMTRHLVYKAVVRAAQSLYGQDHLREPAKERLYCTCFLLRWAMYGLMAGIILWTLISQGMKDINKLRSALGLFVFILVCLLFSANPAKINWHTVFWGVALQFIAALCVLEFDVGRNAILWVQSRLDEFFANSKAGSKLIFGDSYMDHYMVFGALPIIFLSNAMLTVLYYVGAMPFIIKTIGSFLSFVLETSPAENMGVAAGIFLEGVTAILSLRPYLRKMSKSQLFLVITSAYASLGGAYLAVLSTMGVSLSYLIPAMVVSAPATFVVCKLIVPETKLKPQDAMAAKLDVGAEEKSKYSSIFDAAQMGATSMTTLVAQIIVVAFVFFSFIEWFNHTLDWFGQRVGKDGVSIEWISSWVFYPVAFIMGVDLVDCNRVAMLLGYRISVTNIIAFFKLTDMKMNRAIFDEYMGMTNNTGPVSYKGDDVILVGMNKTLKAGFLSDRSEAIVTYALCGFSSAMTVAITTGIMVTLVPRRKDWITRMSLAALIAGNIANCMTGCFASIFY